MCEFLLEEKVMTVKKDSFEGVGVIGGLDRGCTLTKVLFSTEADADHYNLHFALFRNRDFEAGLDYMKQRGMVVLQPGAKLHVTGAGCDKFRDAIREKLGLDIEFIDEMLTLGRGTHWLMANVEDSQLCYPPPELGADVPDLTENRMVRVFIDAWRRDVGPLPEEKFPCLLLYIGSGSVLMKIEANGTTDLVGGVWFAGRSLLGMAKLLLGTGDYDEIMQLAEAGSRENLDTQVQDVLANDPNSPYGTFPPEFPIFSFGKAADTDRQLSDFRREDVALSLVAGLMYNAFSYLTLAAKTLKIGRMYLGGNFFKHSVARREIMNQVAMFGGMSEESGMDVKFMKTGHTGAVGAMVSNPEDIQKYMAFMQQQQQQQ